MAKIFKPNVKAKKRKHQSSAKQLPDFVAEMEKYDHELKAISQAKDGRITFVSGAMQGEQVKIRPTQYTDRLIHGYATEILTSSPLRVPPPCPHFADCGGCQLQYMANDTQLSEKQNALNNLLTKRLKLATLPWQPAINSGDSGYRRAARLAVWHEKSGAITIGFRRQFSKTIVDVNTCHILAPKLTDIVQAFRKLAPNLKQVKHITHLQLFSVVQTALIIRATKALDLNDISLLRQFGQDHQTRVIVQNDTNQFEDLDKDSNSAEILLSYQVDDMPLEFQPKDFIQINDEVNQKMVAQALSWLAVNEEDRVLDLFSGVGNFTLPLAKRVKEVFAVEGVNDMVKRLKANAVLNDISNIKAYQADLSQIDDKNKPSWLKPIDKLLLDPARDGAMAVVKKIPILKPKQILYVSCNPATMLRDLEILLSADYHLTKLGLLNMFPHTHHVEAMALLEYKKA